MLDETSVSALFIALHFMIVSLTLLRVMLRPHREPAARIAWIAIIAALPIVGVLFYLFFGEVNIGNKSVKKMQLVLDKVSKLNTPFNVEADDNKSWIPLGFEQVFTLGRSINGFPAVGGNGAVLLPDSNAVIAALIADIDGAKDHVHLLFYIWLPDNSGRKVVDAVKRAVARGVQCRVMVDSLGSSALVRSKYWAAMKDAGVNLALILPIGNPLLRVIMGRIDLRNHRKIVVIDGRITYCGSQNCADPEFLVKQKFAPWVDIVLRIEGAVAQQNQSLFISDWMVWANEDISTPYLCLPPQPVDRGLVAQAFGTGPTSRAMAMSQMFTALIASALEELIITTPYFIPNEAIQSALQAAAHRGVKTTLVFPENNDSWLVKRASRSYYLELLAAGVAIYEYSPGLLHSKTITIDRKCLMIGSANLDRRSFDLNYENNMLIFDKDIVSDVLARQQEYISQSQGITFNTVNTWSLPSRLVNNTLAVLGPVL